MRFLNYFKFLQSDPYNSINLKIYYETNLGILFNKTASNKPK